MKERAVTVYSHNSMSGIYLVAFYLTWRVHASGTFSARWKGQMLPTGCKKASHTKMHLQKSVLWDDENIHDGEAL